MRGCLILGMLVSLCLCGAAMPVFAQPPTREKALGSFGGWRAYTYEEGGQTVCYMATSKVLKSAGPKKRAMPYLMITHRPVEASTDVVSYDAGAMLNSKRGVKLHIGKKTYDFFSVRGTAWARDSLIDHKIVAALRKASKAELTGFSDKKGALAIRDVFDLNGVDSAYHAISKACGVAEPSTLKSDPSKTKHPHR